MKNILHLGSNQYSNKYKGLKSGTWLLIQIVTILALLLVALALKAAPPPKVVSPLSMSPSVVFADYHQPPLNPNLSERMQNIQLIKRIWGKDAYIGLQLARCESGFRTSGIHAANIDGTIDQGVFSINSVHGMPDMENATANILYAYEVYKQQNTTPWISSVGCWGNTL
jgi:hypothetical protein